MHSESSIWNHPLFSDPVTYPKPSVNLSAAQLDAQIRRLHHMPSTCDEAAAQTISQLNILYQKTEETIVRNQKAYLLVCYELTNTFFRLKRAINGLRSPQAGPRQARLASSLFPTLFAHHLIPEIPTPDTPLSQLLPLLDTAHLLLLDRIARTSPLLSRNYLKSLYKILSQTLQFNTTADATRITPVLSFILRTISVSPHAFRSYCDVGCSIPTGAKNTLSAANFLRPNHITTIHGTDITPPTRALKCSMASQHNILLYQSDTIHHCLPRTYDIILLANVHRHLTRPDQHTLLTHLARSLTPHGLLFINWRFNQTSSPCICLTNTLELHSEANCP